MNESADKLQALPVPWLTLHRDHLILRVVVQPKSSRNQVAGIHGDSLKVHITAPPVDGAANKMCLKVLAKHLHLPPSALSLVSGQTGRHKLIRISTIGGRQEMPIQEILGRLPQ